MRVSEAAAAAAVSVQALRYYERRGLFRVAPKRSSSGYRDYDADAVQRVRFIKKAQDVGFSLEEVRELLELRDQKPSSDAVRQIASGKIKTINDRLQHLVAMRDVLVAMVDACSCSSAQDECPIIEALDERPDQIRRGPGWAPTRKEQRATA